MTGESLYKTLESDLEDARSMLVRMKDLNTRDELPNHEFNIAVNAICLTVHVSFETFVRELFYMCASGDSKITSVKSNVARFEADGLQAVVLGGRKYVDWLPVERTMERALLFLDLGQPFVRLWGRAQVLSQLSNLQVVRNKLAHSGEQAEREYRKRISRGQAEYDQTGPWLIANDSGLKSHLELMIDAVDSAGYALVASARTPTSLGPATAEGVQSAVPPGKYRCTNCSLTVFATSGIALGACRRCAESEQCSKCGNQRRATSKWSLVELKAT